MTCADDAPSTQATRVVDLEGDIDGATAGDLGVQLCAIVTGGHDAVVVRCTGITFVESRGLGVMARVQRFADDAGCRLTWQELPLHVLRTIHLAGLDDYLKIEA